MSLSIAENPAVQAPHKHLKPTQRSALVAVDYFRHQKPDGKGSILIGRHRFKASTLEALVHAGLLKRTREGLAPTMAGKLAVAKLKGETL
ncbi:hypothetical protein [Rhizobium sp. SGZ-381]|uniref:hypothetical protein n=1 Tax=Rhizobium sp. SGZ-381 TaxID=3342800 RepID=UPI003670FC2A